MKRGELQRSAVAEPRPAQASLAHRRRWEIGLIVLAFVLRIIFALAYGIDAPPARWGDDHEYDEIAVGLAFEGRYQNLWFPPGYPLFLAAIYAVFGRQLIVVRLLQGLLGALTCYLTYRVGCRVFGERIGLGAGLLLAFYPGHLYMSWRLMSETLYIFLLVAALALALALSATAKNRLAVALGAILALANAVKSNLIIFPPMILGWSLWRFLRRPAPRFVLVAVLFASFVVGSLLTPVANRVASGGRTALVAGNAGHTFWWSNNPIADGYFISPKDSPAAQAFIERQGMTAAVASADRLTRDRLFRDLALLWIRDHPGDFVVLCLKKLNNAYGLFPRAVVFEGNRLAKAVHLLSWGALLPFIVAGLVISRRCWRQAMVLYLILTSHVVMVLLFYGTPRFTVIVVPAFLIFASVALSALWDRVQQTGRWRRSSIDAASAAEAGG